MIRVATAMLALLMAPGSAMAASYFAIAIDKKTLTVTDIRSPRQVGSTAQTYQIVINRAAKKGRKGVASEYDIRRIDFNCQADKVQQFYGASYDLGGKLADWAPKPKPWAKVKPGSVEATLRLLGCNGVAPKSGFLIGDHRIGEILADYRAGKYDRYIH